MSKGNNGRTTARKERNAYELTGLVEARQHEGLELKWHGKPLLTVPHPALWSDTIMDLATAGENAGTLRALCGDEEYDAFVETTGLGAAIVWDAVKDHYGADSVGESLASSTK